MVRDLQKDIAVRLTRQSGTRSVAQILAGCSTGQCAECGDLCPIKANRWAAEIAPLIGRALAIRGQAPVWKVVITRDRWARARSELTQVSLGAIEKAVRRSLNSLQQPATVAVGIIDAWYGRRQWEIGVVLLVAGPDKFELRDAFPSATLQINEILDIRTAVRNFFESARTAKRTPSVMADDDVPKEKSRGEYYAWLASLAPGSRFFRYGYDRYFNSLKKTGRPIRLQPKKRHPNPIWLAPYQYGSHSMSCDCRICQRQRH